MPVWPKSFYTFGVSLKTASTEWKLRQRRTAPAAQATALQSLMPSLAAASHWRACGVEADMDYAKFRARLPLHSYSQLTPQIERMRAGEADVLWPGTCALFVLSAGTATGQPKHLPVTEEMLVHFRRAIMEALLYYTVRVRHAGVFRGRHLLLGGSTELLPAHVGGTHEAYAADLSGILEVNLPPWADRHLYEPGSAASHIPDWEARLAAIVERTSSRDITLLAGLPSWVLVLAGKLAERAHAHGRDVAHLQELWPNLECFLHTGQPLATFASELRAVLGPDVKFHEVYAAAEGIFATQDINSQVDGLRVMADLGLFFEFLPMSEFNEAALGQLGPKAIPLEEVRTGVDYALLVTTPAGLVRTLVGDVVRFMSVRPPRMLYVGRTEQQMNTFNERVSEKEITDSLMAVCARRDWTVVNFHVAPLLAPGLQIGTPRGAHEWWIELKPGTIATPTGPQIAAEVDAELQRLNPQYAARRGTGFLYPPVVRLVIPGVFEHWLRFAGTWGGLHRLPRCRNDRSIAKPLAEITSFSESTPPWNSPAS